MTRFALWVLALCLAGCAGAPAWEGQYKALDGSWSPGIAGQEDFVLSLQEVEAGTYEGLIRQRGVSIPVRLFVDDADLNSVDSRDHAADFGAGMEVPRQEVGHPPTPPQIATSQIFTGHVALKLSWDEHARCPYSLTFSGKEQSAVVLLGRVR